jgi:hypothetical protein
MFKESLGIPWHCEKWKEFTLVGDQNACVFRGQGLIF